MESKWNIVYQPRLNYDQNLRLLEFDFKKMWLNCLPSRYGEVEDEYDLLALVGRGSYGTVVACESRKTNKIVAVKILLKQHVVDKNQVSHVIFERKILNSICFPFLIYLEFSLKNKSCLYLGLPFIDGGDLFAYHRSLKHFTEAEAKFYASQVLLALEYLHNADIIYRDLKPENLLIGRDGYIKVTDLGYAKKIEGRTYTFCGTPEYLAPELIRLKPYGKSVDWWAFGVLLFEFVAGYSPFSTKTSGATDMTMFERICAQNYTMPFIFSLELKDLVAQLLQYDISKRYGCMRTGTKDVKSHPWFNTIDWLAILNRQITAYYLPKIRKISDRKTFTKEHLRKFQNMHFDRYREEFQDF